MKVWWSDLMHILTPSPPEKLSRRITHTQAHTQAGISPAGRAAGLSVSPLQLAQQPSREGWSNGVLLVIVVPEASSYKKSHRVTSCMDVSSAQHDLNI